MNPILDRFTPSKPASSTFRPSSRQELFALRVAAKLNDAVAANHYAVLLSECSEGQMLCALRHALKSSSGANLAKNFRNSSSTQVTQGDFAGQIVRDRLPYGG